MLGVGSQGWRGLRRGFLNRERSWGLKRVRVPRKVRVHCGEERPDSLQRVGGQALQGWSWFFSDVGNSCSFPRLECQREGGS